MLLHTTATDAEQACYHCGDLGTEPAIISNGQSFCCAGCRAVYELLQECNLERYYALEQQPGKAPDTRDGDERFAYLEDVAVQQRLLDFADQRSGRMALHIPQIHCAACVWLLENLHRLDCGVLQATVDFPRRQLALHFDRQQTSLRRLVELLASLGYEPEITLDSTEHNTADPETRKLVQKLAVAGFCFGNTMLFSFPEYLAAPGELDQQWRSLFAALNILLALPVLFYSSTDYLLSAWRSLKQRTATIDVPIALGIAALFGRSLDEILSASGSGYMDSFTGLVFLLLCGRLFQRQTFAALAFDRDYKAYFPLATTVVDKDGQRSIPLSALQKGMHIRVRHDELIPADSRLLSTTCDIDYSYVTGESAPVCRTRGELLYAGGRVAGSAAEMAVAEEVSQGYLTRLWNDPLFAKDDKSDLRALINSFSKYFTAAILAIAALAALYWLPQDANLATNAFTSVLIIACPCALALTTPYTLGTAINALAAAGLYLKDSAVVEGLGRIDTIAFDKTGTLTSTRDAAVEFIGVPLTAAQRQGLADALANSAHPLSRKLLSAIGTSPGPDPGHYQEQPGKGLRYSSDTGVMLVGSMGWMEENDIADLPKIQPQGAIVCIASDGKYRGHFHIANAYRRHLDRLFAALRPTADLFLLSGDNDGERHHLQALFGDGHHLLFQQSPTDKLEFVRNLRSTGRRVLMVGDGLNDAGALRQSTVGIAAAEDTTNFAPACDAILEAGRLDKLPNFLRFSRACLYIIALGFALSIAYNIVGLSFAVQGELSPLLSAVLMPLSSVSIIAFTTLTTRAVAHHLGVTP